jgi:adenylate cyclase
MGPQEHKVERRLAAIFAADVAGYSRLMEQDEVGTLRTLTAHREIMDCLIAEHGGRIAITAGAHRHEEALITFNRSSSTPVWFKSIRRYAMPSWAG